MSISFILTGLSFIVCLKTFISWHLWLFKFTHSTQSNRYGIIKCSFRWLLSQYSSYQFGFWWSSFCSLCASSSRRLASLDTTKTSWPPDLSPAGDKSAKNSFFGFAVAASFALAFSMLKSSEERSLPACVYLASLQPLAPHDYFFHKKKSWFWYVLLISSSKILPAWPPYQNISKWNNYLSFDKD